MAGETPDVQYEAAEGTPDQMQRGEASDLNAQLPTENPTAPEPAVEAVQDEAVLPAEPQDYDPLFDPETDDEAFITGPTMRPDEAQFVGAVQPRELPPTVKRSLTALQQAATEPGASAELQGLVQYLLRKA